MIRFFKQKLNYTPIKVRLTLWYLLLAGLVVILSGTYQYIQFRRSLYLSVDTSLEISLSQALSSIDIENGNLDFQNTDPVSSASRMLLQSDFTIRLLSPEGKTIDSIGDQISVPGTYKLSSGYYTAGVKETYRVLTQPILDGGREVIGWIQAVQSLELVEETLRNMRIQLLLVLPLILFLTGLGGIFLANRTMGPIDHITRTAAKIGAGDLSRRLLYQGPQDEIGRLAETFDSMLTRLEAAFVRERRFSGDAAHELRTPLTVLKGQIEVTLSKPRQKSDYEDTLRGLISQVDRLIRLSNGLLFLSRSDQQQLSWNPQLLNLSELLEIIIEQIHPLAFEHNLTLRTKIADNLPVLGDTDHLVRLFLNLLDNAVKYTPEGGEIYLVADHEDSGVRIDITNTGSGIPPEHLPHLFERFYRVDSARSRGTGGAGLGLAIAKEVVLLHKGQISVESEPGQRTKFIVFLPRTGQLSDYPG